MEPANESHPDPVNRTEESDCRILTVSVSLAQPLEALNGRTVLSGIGKRPVAGRVPVHPLGLEGDEQADLEAHGGLRKAVYAYSQEHLDFWVQQRRERGLEPFDAPLAPGFLGENLLLSGVLEKDLWIGDTLHFDDSTCVLRVTWPREPCYKLCAVMGFAQAAQVMARSTRTGFYMAVDAEGELAAGMAFRLQPGPRRLSINEATRSRWAKQRNW